MATLRHIPILALVGAVLIFTPPPSRAASGGGGGSRDDGGGEAASSEGDGGDDVAALAYERGMGLVKEGRFQEALERFRVAAKKDKKNPEYLNMVAYSLRKIGNLDDAFEAYGKALAMRPDFPQAREYLGEAHIQAILLQIDVLRGYGEHGRKEHDALVAALQEAAKTLQAEPMGGALPVPDKKSW
jgi:tetratricopeptide (TPR) repeat protein